MVKTFWTGFFVLSWAWSPTAAQPLPVPEAEPQTISALQVAGTADPVLRRLVIEHSGLDVGRHITPGTDPALARAIRAIYRLGAFTHVAIAEAHRSGLGVALEIRVEEAPRLAVLAYTGVKKKHRRALEPQLALRPGTRLRPTDVDRAVHTITAYYRTQGYPLAKVHPARETRADGAVALTLDVDTGPRLEIGRIEIEGNTAHTDRRIKQAMPGTREDRWWRFWGNAAFDRDTFEADLQQVIADYNAQGYYDARVLRDTTYVDAADGTPEMVVAFDVHEGPQYRIRNLVWSGNTVYPDSLLSAVLDLAPGQVYNGTRLNENLYGNARGTDVAGLYLNRGYLKVNVVPHIRAVGPAELDIELAVQEGDVYRFGEVKIAGNGITREAVIRRVLYTLPGQTFSREAIQESLRRLMQLGYFTQTSLAKGPAVRLNEATREVDLTYTLEEAGSEGLTFTGGFQDGLLLQVGLNFNNFSLRNVFNASAWQPVPAGDGQQLGLSVQTNGRRYQRYALNFTEPWFRGKPAPAGFAWSLSRSTDTFAEDVTAQGTLLTTSLRLFYDRRLGRPYRRFTLSSGVQYRYYNNRDWSLTLPDGVNQEVVVREALTYNALDHPTFPRRGTRVQLGAEAALPLPGLAQYHKWRLHGQWHQPLSKKLTLGLSADYGYIGSLTGGAVDFQRFTVGGSPFDVRQGDQYFGRDWVYLRGYPAEAIGPRTGGLPIGGRLLNKYGAELRWTAVQAPQLTVVPYLFADAANTWAGFDTYRPTDLFRSAGIGTRLSVPILGLIDLSYGYNFDRFDPIGLDAGTNRWRFQVSLGIGLGN